MSTLSQIPIRLQLSSASNPPAQPIDANTREIPQAWRCQDIAVQIAVFTSQGAAVDLSNLDSLQVAIQEAQDSPLPLAVKTVDAADIAPIVTMAVWLAGTGQQAEAIFTAAQMDMSLAGQVYRDLWISVIGTTEDGAQLVFGAGTFRLWLASAALPPTPPAGLVSYHAQTNTTGNSAVTPTSQLHTEKLTIAGIARTSAIILGVAGIVAGARLTLWLADLDVATDIVLDVYSGSLTGPLIATHTTDGSRIDGRTEFLYDGSQWQLLPVELTEQPAY
jgi:hypothetical protein